MYEAFFFFLLDWEHIRENRGIANYDWVVFFFPEQLLLYLELSQLSGVKVREYNHLHLTDGKIEAQPIIN